jgi:hypothetical protein
MCLAVCRLAGLDIVAGSTVLTQVMQWVLEIDKEALGNVASTPSGLAYRHSASVPTIRIGQGKGESCGENRQD